MKRILIAAAALLAGVVASAQQMPPMPVDQAVRIGHLENGLTYYVRHNAEPEGQANFYIAQKVGSVLENDDQRGLAHFLEHMCFNGTEHFPGNGVVKYCESIGVKFGADLNAYTSIDETVYNIDNVPVGKIPSAIDSCLLILHDWAGGLLLEDEDIDKERGVIHEEWRQSSNATSRMYEIILPKIYPGNKYGERLPIGTMEVVDNFPYEALRSYYRTWYRPDQQAIIVVGDIDVDEIEAKIQSIFGTLPAAPADAPERVYTPVEDNEAPIFAIAQDKEQPYPIVYIMAKHEPVLPEEKNTLDYLIYQYADAVADIMMSQRLREMTEAADPDFVQAAISDDDFFVSKTKASYFGYCVCDETQVLRGATSVYREMLRAVRNGFTASEYDRARNELISSIETQYNQREKRKSASYCREYVRHFIDNEPIPGIETEFALIQQLAPNIPVELVNEVVKSHMTEGRNLVVACMLPQKEGLVYPTEEEFAAAFAAVQAETIAPYEDKVSDQPLISKIRKPGKIKKVSEDAFGYTKMVLSNGATVYLKTTDYNKDEILLQGFSWGGTSLYPVTPTLKVVDELPGIGGVGEFSKTELSKALAGKQCSLNTTINLASEGVVGMSTPKDFETMMQLLYLGFTAPRQDADAFKSWKTKTAAMLLNAEAEPMTAFMDTMRASIAVYPERLADLKLAELDQVDYDYAMQIYKERFANAGDFTFVITGAIDFETAKPMIEKYIASLPGNGKKKENFVYNFGYADGVKDVAFTRAMETPMATNFFFYTGDLETNLDNKLELNVACETLSIVLLEEIREKEGGTYGISAYGGLESVGESTGYMQIVYQCSPDKYEYLNSRVEAIVAEFLEKGPVEENLAKTKEYLSKKYKQNQTENSYWQSVMTSWLQYGADYHTGYLEAVEALNADTVKNCLKSVVDQNNVKTVVMVGTQK